VIAVGAYALDPAAAGELTALPRYPSFAAEKKGQSKHCRTEEGEEEWRDGEGMERKGRR